MNTQNENTQKADALIAELNALHPISNVPKDDWMDEVTLERLGEILDELWATGVPERGITALFGLFERFPGYDGCESFWSILHGLESFYKSENAPKYEAELVASVRRVPCEFNLSMVNRILNVDQTHAGGTDLLGLLQETADRADASDDARKDALGYVEYQANRNKNT